METENTLPGYFKKLEKSINKKLKKQVMNYDKEDYHKLRVDIKKLKALMNFVEFCCGDFKQKKILKPLKKIFKQSGKVREFQLEKSILDSYRQFFSLKGYMAKLNSRIKKEQKKFSDTLNKKLQKNVRKNLDETHSFLHKTEKCEMGIYIKNENEKIHSLIMREPLKAEQVHELRKLLKTDYYTRKSMGLPAGENDLRKEGSFLDLLGKWHDYRTTNGHLGKSILKNEMDLIELSQALKIKEEISFDEKNLFKKINAALRAKNLLSHEVR